MAIAIVTYVIAMTDTRNWLNFASKLKILVCFNMEPNVGKTWSLCNIIFVSLTCFYFANFFGKEKFSALPSRNKVADIVRTFWEVHKIWKKNPHGFDVYQVNVQCMRNIAQIFVCFSESPNFKNLPLWTNFF